MTNSTGSNLKLDDLDQRIEFEQSTIDAVQALLIEQFQRYGFENLTEAVAAPLVNAELRKDSFDGNQSLFAEWRTPTGALLGYLLIHGEGQVYAEFDVLQLHPTKKQWVIEAITAWGDRNQLKAEPRLLPALAD